MAVKIKTPLKIALILGTRPEAIKMAPVFQSLRSQPQWFKPVLVATGQHREMLDQALRAFGLRPDVNLRLMKPDQSPADFLAHAVPACQAVLKPLSPDAVLVQGDTGSTLAGALASFYLRIPVGHVEAGLRTHDLDNPFPEEMYRRLVTTLARWHFAATPGAAANLLAEAVPASRIFVAGNPVVDSLRLVYRRDFSPERLGPALGSGSRLVLITAHRRENFGEPLAEICHAAKRLSRLFPEVQFVFPVHPNPGVRKSALAILKSAGKNLSCVDPLPYADFINLLARSELVLTDSGGVQEEAPVFGVRALILRKVTERPEALAAGARLLACRRDEIIRAASQCLSRSRAVQGKPACPFGDGKAGDRITRYLAWSLGLAGKRPRPFQP